MPSSLNGRDIPDSVGTRDNNHGIRDNATKDVTQAEAHVMAPQVAEGDSRQGNSSPTSDTWNWMMSYLDRLIDFEDVVKNDFLLKDILTNLEPRLLDNLLASVLAAVEARKGQGGDDESISRAPKEITDDRKPAAREKSDPAGQSPEAGPDAMSHHGDDSVLESTAGVARKHPRPDEDHVRAPPGKRVNPTPSSTRLTDHQKPKFITFDTHDERLIPHFLLGRGQANWQLRHMKEHLETIEQAAAEYETSANTDKKAVGARIVEKFKTAGTLFLIEPQGSIKGHWYEADDETARESVQQKLREAVWRRNKVRQLYDYKAKSQSSPELQQLFKDQPEAVLELPRADLRAWLKEVRVLVCFEYKDKLPEDFVRVMFTGAFSTSKQAMGQKESKLKEWLTQVEKAIENDTSSSICESRT